DLRQETHRVFSAAIDFRVALLTPISFDLRDRHPLHPDRRQSVSDLIELERLDNGHDDFHALDPPLGPALAVQAQGRYTIPGVTPGSENQTACQVRRRGLK